MNVIEISGLNHRYGRTTSLRDVSLGVPEGAVYALLGPNGAGKSTLLRILMRLQPQGSGRVVVFGKDRHRLTLDDRALIGYVAEGQKLPQGMTIGWLEDYLAPLYPRWDSALAADLHERLRLD